jgi:hypothetical protein
LGLREQQLAIVDCNSSLITEIKNQGNSRRKRSIEESSKQQALSPRKKNRRKRLIFME